MSRIYDVHPGELIEKAAEELKKIGDISAPEWSNYVKTGTSKQRVPDNRFWWHVRAASILRWVYIRGPVGVQKLRTKYGSKKNRGHAPEKFFKASGNIIRKILQQLEKAELIKQEVKGVHKGRVIMPKGISLLDKAANIIAKSQPKPAVKATAKKEAVASKENSAKMKKEVPKAEKISEDKSSVIPTATELATKKNE